MIEVGRAHDARWSSTSAAVSPRPERCSLSQRSGDSQDLSCLGLAAADNLMSWANHQLDQARAKAHPHVERYNQASAAVNDARTALHQHLLDARRECRTASQIPELEQRRDALDTWRDWATGGTVDPAHLGTAVDSLVTVTGPHANRYRALGQLVQQWAAGAGIDLPTSEPPRLTRQIGGPDLGL